MKEKSKSPFRVRSEAIRDRCPRVVGVQPVQATNVGAEVGNVLGCRMKDDTGAKATSASDPDILPRESGADRGGGYQEQLEGREAPHGDEKQTAVCRCCRGSCMSGGH